MSVTITYPDGHESTVTLPPDHYELGRAAGLAGQDREKDFPAAYDPMGNAARQWCLGHAAGKAERKVWLAAAAKGEAREMELGEAGA